MAKTEIIRARIEPEVKARAVDLFDSLDLSTSDAITLFIHECLKIGGLPFQVDKEAEKNAK